MKTRFPSCLLAIPVVLALAPPVRAHVAGGGPSASDCYLEFEGVESTSGVRVECTDGDPACDHDGACGNGCTFEIQACAFRTDSALPDCAPQPVTGFSGNNAGLALPGPTPITAETCGAPTPVTVALKRKGKKAGKRLVKLTATTDGKPKKDKDKLLLRCLPRTGACPDQFPPTTTTTTVSGPTTTRFTTTTFTGTTTTTTVTTTTCPPNGLGIRMFTPVNSADPNVGSHFYSTGAAGGKVDSLNSFRGSIELCGGVLDAGTGVATLAVNSDSIIGWKVVDNSFLCVKILAAGSMGKLDCDGGTPVDMSFHQDSHGEGDNEDEILETELGAAGPAGSGYLVAPMRIVHCPDAEACPTTLTNATDCANPAKVDFSFASPSIHGLTTGSVTSAIINPRQGTPVTLTKTGEPFSCASWTQTDGPGVINGGILGVDTQVGDIANVLRLDD